MQVNQKRRKADIIASFKTPEAKKRLAAQAERAGVPLEQYARTAMKEFTSMSHGELTIWETTPGSCIIEERMYRTFKVLAPPDFADDPKELAPFYQTMRSDNKSFLASDRPKLDGSSIQRLLTKSWQGNCTFVNAKTLVLLRPSYFFVCIGYKKTVYHRGRSTSSAALS